MSGILNMLMAQMAASGGGPDVWYWAGTGKGDANFTTESDSGWAIQTFAYGANITVATGGTCTFIAAKLGNDGGSDINFKIALFNSSNALIASGTGTVTAGTASLVWSQAAVSVSVTAGTYYILVSGSASGLDIGYDTGQNGIFDDVVYASFPPNPSSPSVETNQIYGVKMYVD